MQPQNSKRQDRYPYLDALRGLAALWVVMVHIAMLPYPRIPLSSWMDLFVVKGVMGVELFFVVSAFSLCLSMPSHGRDARPILGFAIRRFFRIAPLFYLMIVFMSYRNISGVVIDWKSISLNILFLFNLVPGYQVSIVPAGWTIGVEMVFYLIFPVLYRYTQNIWLATAAVFVSLGIAQIFLMTINLFVSDPVTYHMFSILYRAPIFMFGLVAFYALPLVERLKDRRHIGYALLASVPVLFLEFRTAMFRSLIYIIGKG
ncbi:acyltransferase (plasmid) [Phyllobacterium sp. A18/5-2]|uniref:acyltransferase family protein n=1 Tax=Phyllobacterium sp. A18/5-2 TaxID=2978392 RepID=UPI0021C74010|nr:acyltransferase [Phyllobacterium sp. A18/5-2]UXN66757.1 acyltransferase [Phyllobacterium sp. A18/5-2]